METSTVLALDVGSRRIGVATANTLARLARPFKTLNRSGKVINEIQHIIIDKAVIAVVVGLPRGMEGQTTQQTRDTLDFVKALTSQLNIPVYIQDEAVTSRQAEAELQTKGKDYTKGDIDALAATIILEDWLLEHQEAVHG